MRKIPKFILDIFGELLGYTDPSAAADYHAISQQTAVVVDGQLERTLSDLVNEAYGFTPRVSVGHRPAANASGGTMR